MGNGESTDGGYDWSNSNNDDWSSSQNTVSNGGAFWRQLYENSDLPSSSTDNPFDRYRDLFSSSTDNPFDRYRDLFSSSTADPRDRYRDLLSSLPDDVRDRYRRQSPSSTPPTSPRRGRETPPLSRTSSRRGSWSPPPISNWHPDRETPPLSRTSSRRGSWSPLLPSDTDRDPGVETRSLSPSRSPVRDRHLIGMGINPREWGDQGASTSGPSQLEREQAGWERQIKEIEFKSWIEAGRWRTFENTRAGDLAAELDTAEVLGIRPLHVDDLGFEQVANQGLIKWAVTQDGELLTAPNLVAHTMLTNGEAVVAAGEAKIELGENGYVCREITNRSDHYGVDDRSLEVGRRAFEQFGIQFEEERQGLGGHDEANRGIGSSDAGALRVFANTRPEDLAAELETAELLEIRPLCVDDPDFGSMAKEGPIKWVVLESGELLTAPHLVAHTVLSAGEAVLAAGDAIVVENGNERFCIEITTNSDHYSSDDQSLEIGKQAFAAFGVRFVEEERSREGGHGEGKTREDGDDPVIQQETRSHAERSGHVDQSDRALGGEQSDGLVRPSRLSFWERERLREKRQIKEEELKSWIEAENRPAFKIVREDDLLFELQAELQTAATLGMNPVHVNDPGFGRWARVGLMKWVVTPEGELLFAPQTVEGVEIVHTMLTNGYDVVAAGEAKIALGESGYVCREITPVRDLYQPDERSLEVGRRAFEAFGIAFEEEGQRAGRQTDGNGGENGEGNGSGYEEQQRNDGGGGRSGFGGGNGGGDGEGPQVRYEESSSSSDEEGKGHRRIDENKIKSVLKVTKKLLRMWPSRRRVGDEGTSQGSGIQVERVRGDSQALLPEFGARQGRGGGEGSSGGGDGGKLVVYDGYDSDADGKDQLSEAREKFFDVIDAYTNKRLAEEARAERLEELAKDPAKGGRVDDKTRREAEVALQLEEMGLLAGPIRRDPSGDAEFIDRRGTLWDVKQFHSENGHFNLGKAVETIRREIRAGENVILDTKFLDPNDAAALRSAIETNGWQRKILWSKGE